MKTLEFTHNQVSLIDYMVNKMIKKRRFQFTLATTAPQYQASLGKIKEEITELENIKRIVGE